MNDKNFLNALDDWGSILTNTYDEAVGTNLLGVKGYNEEPTLFTVDKNPMKSLTNEFCNRNGKEYIEQYTSKYNPNEVLYVYFRAYTGYCSLHLNQVFLSFKVGEQHDNPKIDRFDTLYIGIYCHDFKNEIVKFNERTSVEATLLNHEFLKDYIERAITKLNDIRKVANDFNILPIDDEEGKAFIFNKFKERTKNLS